MRIGSPTNRDGHSPDCDCRCPAVPDCSPRTRWPCRTRPAFRWPWPGSAVPRTSWSRPGARWPAPPVLRPKDEKNRKLWNSQEIQRIYSVKHLFKFARIAEGLHNIAASDELVLSRSARSKNALKGSTYFQRSMDKINFFINWLQYSCMAELLEFLINHHFNRWLDHSDLDLMLLRIAHYSQILIFLKSNLVYVLAKQADYVPKIHFY